MANTNIITYKANNEEEQLNLSDLRAGDLCVRLDQNKLYIAKKDGTSLSIGDWQELPTSDEAVTKNSEGVIQGTNTFSGSILSKHGAGEGKYGSDYLSLGSGAATLKAVNGKAELSGSGNIELAPAVVTRNMGDLDVHGDIILTGKINNVDITSLSNGGPQFTPENSANKGRPSGYAELDKNGKVPMSQLPEPATSGSSPALTTATITGTTPARNETRGYDLGSLENVNCWMTIKVKTKYKTRTYISPGDTYEGSYYLYHAWLSDNQLFITVKGAAVAERPFEAVIFHTQEPNGLEKSVESMLCERLDLMIANGTLYIIQGGQKPGYTGKFHIYDYLYEVKKFENNAITVVGYHDNNTFSTQHAMASDGTIYAVASKFKTKEIVLAIFDGKSWTENSHSMDTYYSGLMLAVDGSSVPHVFCNNSKSGSKIIKFVGGQWTSANINVLDRYIRDIAIRKNNLYAAYYADSSYTSWKLCIASISLSDPSSTWKEIQLVTSSALPRHAGLATDSSGALYTAYYEGSYRNRSSYFIKVLKLNAQDSWDTVCHLGIPYSVCGSGYNSNNIHFTVNPDDGTPYIGYIEPTANRDYVRVYGFYGNDWQKLDIIKSVEGEKVSAYSTSIKGINLAPTSDGYVYVGYVDIENRSPIVLQYGLAN